MSFNHEQAVTKRNVGSLLIDQIEELITHPQLTMKIDWLVGTLPAREWNWEKELYAKLSPLNPLLNVTLECFEYKKEIYHYCNGRVETLLGSAAYDWLKPTYHFGNIFDQLTDWPFNILHLDLCGGFYPESFATLRAFVENYRKSLKLLIITFNESWRYKGNRSQHVPEFQDFHDRVEKEMEKRGPGQKSQLMRDMFYEMIKEYCPDYQEVFHCRYKNETGKDVMNTMAVNLSGCKLQNTYFEDRVSTSMKRKTGSNGSVPETRERVKELLASGISGQEIMVQTKITADQLAGIRAAVTRKRNVESRRTEKDVAATQQTLIKVASKITNEEILQKLKTDDALLKSLGPAFGRNRFTQNEYLFHAKAYFSWQQYRDDGYIEEILGSPGIYQLSRKYIEEIGIPEANQELAVR